MFKDFQSGGIEGPNFEPSSTKNGSESISQEITNLIETACECYNDLMEADCRCRSLGNFVILDDDGKPTSERRTLFRTPDADTGGFVEQNGNRLNFSTNIKDGVRTFKVVLTRVLGSRVESSEDKFEISEGIVRYIRDGRGTELTNELATCAIKHLGMVAGKLGEVVGIKKG